MPEWAAKRFWRDVTIAGEGDGFDVRLDGRPLRTPQKSPLILPSAELARGLAAEWAAQEDVVDPRTMPLTRLANAAIDKVVPQIDEVRSLIAAYGETDLVCYRAPAPDELAALQAAAWDPFLDWAAERYGARLSVGEGVIPVAQTAAALARLRAAVDAFDAFGLTALHELVSLSGSLVLGLAATEGRDAPERLWAISRIDEQWQAEQWGRDEEAEAASSLKRDAFLTAAEFLVLARGIEPARNA